MGKLTRDDVGNYGIPQKRLHGHGHFISDVVLSSDGHFALSGSWDKTLRLWDLSTGKTTRRFEDHTKDVLSVAFSADNRQIVSAARDKTIKLWNTLAQCKYTIQEDGHQDWVSCVRFSPNNQNPIIVSAGWDKYVKVWILTVPCVLPVARTPRPCCGTLTTGSICTRWTMSTHKRTHFQSQQILAVCCYWSHHQDLGPGEQEHGGGASSRGPWQCQSGSTSVSLSGLVC